MIKRFRKILHINVYEIPYTDEIFFTFINNIFSNILYVFNKRFLNFINILF